MALTVSDSLSGTPCQVLDDFGILLHRSLMKLGGAVVVSPCCACLFDASVETQTHFFLPPRLLAFTVNALPYIKKGLEENAHTDMLQAKGIRI